MASCRKQLHRKPIREPLPWTYIFSSNSQPMPAYITRKPYDSIQYFFNDSSKPWILKGIDEILWQLWRRKTECGWKIYPEKGWKRENEKIERWKLPEKARYQPLWKVMTERITALSLLPFLGVASSGCRKIIIILK